MWSATLPILATQGLVLSSPVINLQPFLEQKIKTILADLDSTSRLADPWVTIAASPPIAQLVQFDPVVKEEASRVMASCRPTASLLDLCPVCVIRAMKGAMTDWVMNIINSSLREGMLPSHLKETIIHHIIKCPPVEVRGGDGGEAVAKVGRIRGWG